MQLPPRCEFVMNWNSDILSTYQFSLLEISYPSLSLLQLWQLQKYFMRKFGWLLVQENVLISSQIRHMVRVFEFQCECTLIQRDFENVIFVFFILCNYILLSRNLLSEFCNIHLNFTTFGRHQYFNYNQLHNNCSQYQNFSTVPCAKVYLGQYGTI